MSRSSQHDPTDGERHEQPADDTPDTGDGRDAPPVGEAPAGETEQAPAEPVKEATPLTQQLGRVVIVLLVVLFAIFAVDNSQPVDFSWVFGDTTVDDDPGGGQTGGVPLIVLLLIAFVIGGLIGSFVSWQLARSRRRRER